MGPTQKPEEPILEPLNLPFTAEGRRQPPQSPLLPWGEKGGMRGKGTGRNEWRR